MSVTHESMVRDELVAVVAALRARFPDRSRSDVERVVADVYSRLVASARVTAHLIPLTLNRSRRLLESTATDTVVAEPTESTESTLMTVGSE